MKRDARARCMRVRFNFYATEFCRDVCIVDGSNNMPFSLLYALISDAGNVLAPCRFEQFDFHVELGWFSVESRLRVFAHVRGFS